MEEELDILGSYYSPLIKMKTNMISKMLEGKRVLEVGCGTGNLIRFLSNNELELMGSDISEKYLNKAKKKNPSIDFFKADLLEDQSWNIFENFFDSVIASEVIEHIDDELKALKTIHSVLKPNGVLIVTVPAFNLLYSLLDKKIGHFRRYSKKSICKVLENAGFKIEKTFYWNFLGFLGWLITFKILKKDFQVTKKTTLPYILGKWLKIESIKPTPIGLTIFVKAKKVENE